MDPLLCILAHAMAEMDSEKSAETQRVGWWQRLKQRWDIHSDQHMGLIWVIFAVTGSSSGRLFSWLMRDVEWYQNLFWLIRFPLWLVMLSPLYFLILYSLGSLLGQERFYRWFILRFFRRMTGQKASTPSTWRKI